MAYFEKHVWSEGFFEVIACLYKKESYEKLQHILTPDEATNLAGELASAISDDCFLSIIGQLYPFMQLYSPSWEREERFFDKAYPAIASTLDVIADELQFLTSQRSMGIGSSTGSWRDDTEIPRPKFA